jgi:hypothetical protein
VASLLTKISKEALVIRKHISITGGTHMTPQKLRDLLDKAVLDIKTELNLYVHNPEHSFLRNRKLPFEKVISIMLAMEGRTINNELLYQFNCSTDTASASAFVQQRNKIKADAFEILFRKFTSTAVANRNIFYKEYRLLAIDGSHIQIAASPDDVESFVQTKEDRKPYNLIYLNAMYDVLSKIYIDAIIQKNKTANERKAINDMVDKSSISQPVIVLADRGYESYNVLAHIQQKQWNFLIRIQDFGKYNTGILHGFDLPGGNEFDIDIDLNLTRKQTHEVKELLKDKNHYRKLNFRNFDYLPAKNKKHEPVNRKYIHD